MSMTPQEMALVNQLIEKVNRLERRLALQETIEGASGSYSNEDAQDAVGNILVDSSTIDFTYSDATPSITAAVKANSITDTFIRDGGALSVIGRPVNSTGDPSDISASAASGAVLRESGSILAFGTVATAGLAANAVTNAKAAQMANATVKGRTTAGTGDPEDLTMAQLVTLIEAQALYALLAGRSGGQTLKGGTASGDDLTLMSTNNATKGNIFFGTSTYDEVNNRLGVGATDPAGEIEAISTSTSNATRGLTSSQHNSGAQAAVMSFRKSRGSRASQTTVANGDFIGNFIFQPYDGANYLRTAQIAAKAVGTVGAASVPTDLLFAAGDTDDASLTNVRMTIKSTGLVGIGEVAPGGQLQVEQASTTAAIPTLWLRQADLSEEMIRFETTVGAGNPVNTTAAGTRYGRVRVYVEGVGEKWLELYNT